MENIRKNQKQMPEIRNTVAEMKNTFDGLICFSSDWESLSEFEDRSVDPSHTEIQKDNEDNPEQNTQ